MSKVTVIIPTYNRADKIEKSIKSVLDQTYDDFILIVVDDCSMDNTEEIVRNIGDERIVFHRLSENKGAGGARNEGVRLAETEYIAFHDSDDLWLPDKLEKQIKYMDDHPDTGLVYGKMRVNARDGSYAFPDEAEPGELEGDIFSWLLRRNTIGTPVMFIRKKCFDNAGGFDASLRCLEDWEFAIRFSERFKIGFLNDILIDTYPSDAGVSRNVGAYYETRCKIVSRYKNDMIKFGIFDEVITDIFSIAEKLGVLDPVKKMLMSYLA